jgi:hypothetical protein
LKTLSGNDGLFPSSHEDNKLPAGNWKKFQGMNLAGFHVMVRGGDFDTNSPTNITEVANPGEST